MLCLIIQNRSAITKHRVMLIYFSHSSCIRYRAETKLKASHVMRAYGRPGRRRPSTIRRASRFREVGRPLCASNTTTYEVSTSASRPARAALLLIGARIRDGGRRLRGEQHQYLLVGVGERRAALLLHEVEVAHVGPAVAHRRPLEGHPRQPLRREDQRADVGGNVGDAKRFFQFAEELEEPLT